MMTANGMMSTAVLCAAQQLSDQRGDTNRFNAHNVAVWGHLGHAGGDQRRG